ncbi:hypothetical protein N5E96_15520 [Pseudomonas mosselii]|uniref:Uncharacterized protein n=1 Tax=Pseudomonas mosselii TaxID=78327 RepID=A0A290H756_9PSED|nr:hypothetical protein [Pseudomonas mosselii]ATB67402.1 hypothetical protein CLJ08_23395 [Pseudomonas mosselii]KXG82057.1 hypothetical protein AXZ07_14870 [Pseudomonas mosselii]MBA6067556.1 hypothetical protein [Pseudomonas mosselii]MBC3456905.1 hypothetical protein [Pseudomonas mosselii]MCH7420570.1 hypothetical protein [Pseudomonas mosselii]
MSDKKQPPADISAIKTPEDLLELAADERLKLAQLKTLIEIHPGIVNASIEAVQALAKTSEVAGKSQVEAIGALKASINGTIDVLKILAQNAQSDSTREKIALALIELAKQHKELSLAIERMNSSNNGIWKKIAIGIGAVATLVVGGVAAAAMKK